MSSEDSRLADAYKRLMLGKSQISYGDAVHIPKQVIKNYELQKGDVLQWFSGSFDVDFPDSQIQNMLVIIIAKIERKNGNAESRRKMNARKP